MWPWSIHSDLRGWGVEGGGGGGGGEGAATEFCDKSLLNMLRRKRAFEKTSSTYETSCEGLCHLLALSWIYQKGNHSPVKCAQRNTDDNEGPARLSVLQPINGFVSLLDLDWKKLTIFVSIGFFLSSLWVQPCHQVPPAGFKRRVHSLSERHRLRLWRRMSKVRGCESCEVMRRSPSKETGPLKSRPMAGCG